MRRLPALLLFALSVLLVLGPIGCLARSAARGDVNGVKYYLAKGDSPDSRDWRRRTALELAIILKRDPVVDVLIEAGANMNKRNYRARTPLIWASSRFGNPELIEKLIAAGADPDLGDNVGQTPLFYSILEGTPKQTQALIVGGADVDKVMTPKWKTPVLDVAIRLRKPAAVQMLVAGGANIEATNGRRKTAHQLAGRDANLQYAIDRGLQERGETPYAIVPRVAPARPSPAPAPARVSPRPRTQTAARPPAPQPTPLRQTRPSARTAPTSHAASTIGAGLRLGDYHALVIGNDEYRNLPRLETAVNDARAVGDVLEKRYGYTVKTLFNATRSEILKSLSQYRQILGPDDNLIIYYAGHGWLDKDEDRGYWLPVDASQSDDVHWIPNESITSKTRAIEAKHVMVIADSCYSGKLVRGIHVNTPTPNYLKKLATRRARVVLTSGGIEPVSDAGGRNNHSVFASALLDALIENTEVLEGHELFTRIRRPVAVNSDQIPEYSDIRKAGHDGGDFLFIPR